MSGLTAVPDSPYKGLAPFDDSEQDALLFFGRERDAEVIAANVASARLTVLFGPSGVGKSSLLRAGVAQRLRALPDVAVVVHDRWSGDPAEAVRRAVELPGLPRPRADLALADSLEEWTEAHDVDLLLLLDQFEELVAYHSLRNGGAAVLDELGELAARPGLRVNVLVAVRDDALAVLDALTGRVPGVFSNAVRLDRLDRDRGRLAILGPLERWNELTGEGVEAEPALVEAVLDGATAPDGVEAPYLQLVLQRVWDVARASGSTTLRAETLERLGGAEAVVREHLGRAVDALGADGRDVAARVFNHLVTPSGTKIAHGLDDLAGYGSVPRDRLVPVLDVLGRHRIVRPLDGGRYEIFHDVLAAPVLAWRAAHDAEARLAVERRRQRRLLGLAVTSLALLAVMTAVAVYALSQRTEAREQARAGEGRAFAAGAWASVESDPELAMLLALEAVRREPSTDAEDVLRRSLERSRLLRVLPASDAPAELLDDPLADQAGGVSARATGGRVDLGGAATGARPLLHRARVRTVDVHPSGRVVTAAGRAAFLWDGRTGRPLARLDGHTGNVVGAALSPDGTLVATASLDSTARVWDAASGRQLDILFGHDNFVVALAFSPDGETLATASRDGTARLWEVVFGRPLAVLAGHGDAVTAVAFLEGGAVVASAGADGAVRRWEGRPEPTAEPSQAVPDAASPTAVSSRGRRAVADGDVVRLSGGGEPERVLRGHTNTVTSVEFSRDGRLVVTASADKDARLWDAADGRHVRLLRRHFGPVADASFSPDGRWVVTAGPSKAGLWEASTGRFLFYIRGHAQNLVAAAFAPGGRTVVTADRAGEARAYACEVCGDLEELVALAERRLAATGRTLTTAERLRYAP